MFEHQHQQHLRPMHPTLRRYKIISCLLDDCTLTLRRICLLLHVTPWTQIAGFSIFWGYVLRSIKFKKVFWYYLCRAYSIIR